MPLQVGIVGLPNVGKSTLFNTLLDRRIAAAENYPFTTIEPNVGVVPVPDENLAELALLLEAGSRKMEAREDAGNSKSESNNQHPAPTPASSDQPQASVAAVPATIEFVDIAGLVQNAHQGEGLGNQFLAQIKEVDAIVHLLRGFKDPQVAHVHVRIDPEFDREIINLELTEAGLNDKPTLLVLNTDQPSHRSTDLPILEINAKTGAGVDRLIQKTYRLLDLITFYTIRDDHQEVRAWPLKKGTPAPRAAGKVHSDFEKFFIKAEVVSFDELQKAGGWKQAKQKGKLRVEGTEYRIKDEDVVRFRVNV